MPFSELPLDTQQAFQEQLQQGYAHLEISDIDGALRYFDAAWLLHPWNADAVDALDELVDRVAVLYSDARSPEMAALLAPSLEAMRSNPYWPSRASSVDSRRRFQRSMQTPSAAILEVVSSEVGEQHGREDHAQRKDSIRYRSNATSGCWYTSQPVAEEQTAAEAEAEKFYIVDCLLPGQVRRLGNTTYMTPRRPIRTTAQDCAIRGGEYTEWDRADYQSALTVWLDAASTGDAQAMNYVGEIFEQGLGRAPDYTMAKYWYERAVTLISSLPWSISPVYTTPGGALSGILWSRSICTDRRGVFPKMRSC